MVTKKVIKKTIVKHPKHKVVEGECFDGTMKEFFHRHINEMNYAFLGAGLTLFVMNITSLLRVGGVRYDTSFFNISVFASMILVIVAVYGITNKN